VKKFDTISYGRSQGKAASSSSRCSGDEPLTSCVADSDDEMSLHSSLPSADSISNEELPVGEIQFSGIPISVESHMVPYTGDPLRLRSQQSFVHMPPREHCQVIIQTPIDFRLPTTVIISLSTKIDKSVSLSRRFSFYWHFLM